MGRPRRTPELKESRTGRRMSRLVQYLRLRPGEQFTTGWLAVETETPRQTVTTALEALRAAGLVERGYDLSKQLTTWRWQGGDPLGAELPARDGARARPRIRPPASEDEAEYRAQLQREGWGPEW